MSEKQKSKDFYQPYVDRQKEKDSVRRKREADERRRKGSQRRSGRR